MRFRWSSSSATGRLHHRPERPNARLRLFFQSQRRGAGCLPACLLSSYLIGLRSPMTPTLNKFAARLAELQGTPRRFSYCEGPPAAATIAARHEAVGNLTISDDGDELTIDIGHKHHTHVSCYDYDQYPVTECLNMVARDAAAFVNDVMCDRVCITVDYFGERRIGSSHFCDDEENGTSSLVRGIGVGATSGERRSERFRWSGPLT